MQHPSLHPPEASGSQAQDGPWGSCMASSVRSQLQEVKAASTQHAEHAARLEGELQSLQGAHEQQAQDLTAATESATKWQSACEVAQVPHLNDPHICVRLAASGCLRGVASC